MQESDWDRYLEEFVAQTKSAIDAFATRHPKAEVCYFAYDSEPRYGYVLTCFNTTEASIEHTRKWSPHHTKRLTEILGNPIWFDSAYYQAKSHSSLPFCNNTGDFAYQGFSQIEFPEWGEYAESPDYPKSEDADEDYLLNRLARLFCRSFDRLIEERCFEKLTLARPTLIGFGFHDEGQHIIHMLNLPGS